MVEPDGLPVRDGVAGRALPPKLAFVDVIRLMTGDAGAGRVAEFLSVLVAFLARNPGMTAGKRIIGQLVIERPSIEGRDVEGRAPVFRMTVFAGGAGDGGSAPVKSALAGGVGGDIVVAVKAKCGLAGLVKRRMAGIASRIGRLMRCGQIARSDKFFDRALAKRHAPERGGGGGEWSDPLHAASRGELRRRGQAP